MKHSKIVIFFSLILYFGECISSEGSNLQVLTPKVHSLSSNNHHQGPLGFTPNGTFIFWQASKDFSENKVLFAAIKDDKWMAGTPSFVVPKYNSGYAPIPGGHLFTSDADTERKDLPDQWNIWRALKRDADKIVEVLPPPINSEKSECCLIPGPYPKFYFSSDRQGSWDIYEAELNGTELENVRRLNQPNSDKFGEWPSFVSADGKYLLFSSIRDSGFGGDDIYISFYQDTGWSAPEILPDPINTEAYEDSGIVSQDGESFIWSSRRPTNFSKGVGNIYSISISGSILESVFLKKPN